MEAPGGLTCRKCGLVLADHIHNHLHGTEACEGEFGTREEMLTDFKRRMSWRVALGALLDVLFHPLRTLAEIGAGLRYQTARVLEEGMQEEHSFAHARMVREIVLAMPSWKFAILFIGMTVTYWGERLLEALGVMRFLRYVRQDD